MDLFHDSNDDEVALYVGDFLDRSLVQFCFLQLIQNDLNELVTYWNTHHISSCCNAFNQGNRHVMMYCLPELYNMENRLRVVDPEDVSFCEEETLPKEHIPCDSTIRELCCLMMQESGPDMPSDASEELKDTAPAMEEPEEEKISTKDLEEIESALEEIAEQKQLNIEKEELQDLKEEVEEYKEDLEDLKSVILASGRPQEDLRESKAAQRLTKRVSKMISQLDDVISGLHKEKQKFQEELEVKQVRMKWTSEQKDDERLQQIRKEIAEEKNTIISINEMVLALKRIQKVPDETKLQTIVEVLDQDMDGIIDINDALKVIETLGRENVKLNKSQVTEMLELLRQEDVIQEEEKRREKEEKENTKQGTEQQQQQQQQ